MSRYSWLHEGTESAPITRNDLEQLENYADRLFAKVGIDVEFTRHFLDRVNDERNQRQITMAELTRLFKQEFKKYGKKIASMGPDAEAVMKDMKTDVNMPFVLQWDPTNQELDLVAKTVMRKKDFKTSNPEFAVEAWSEKYKDSIDCSNPKGFSQKAHCAGKKKNNEEIEETSPIALAKRFIDPVIKSGSYKKAAKTLYDILQRKKQEDGKLRHGIAYYAQQLAKSFSGVDYRALEDYLRDHYDVAQFESKFTPMELAIMEGGHSLNDVNKKVLTHEQQKIVEKLQSKWLDEIKVDNRISKTDVDRYDWDEFISQTEPVTKIKGYEIHFIETRGSHHYLIKNPDDDGFLGELKLDKYRNYYQSSVFFDPEIQGKGLGLPLYVYVIKKGYTLVSDSSQSKGSREGIWKKLSQVPGIFVYAWDTKYDEFFQWNPEEDMDSEIYFDQDKLYQLDQDYKDGKINDKDYKIAKAELSQVNQFSDIRLVAISTKKKVSERLVKLDPKGPSNLKKPQKKSKYSKRKDAFGQSDSDDLNDSIYEKLQNKWMLENPEELDEGWKETLGSLAIASSLALGSMGAMTVKQALDSPKFTPSEKVEIFKAANLPANQLPDELKLATPEPRPDGEYKPITNSKNELILLSAAKKAGLKGTELAAFMAQMAHESENFKDMVEDNPNIKKYGTGRTAKALGNKNVTDGERFIGRGFIQLTGRWNYEWMQKSLGIDLTSTWSKAHQASKPEVAAQIALEFWKQRVRPKVSDWSDVAQVTKPINKALHGLDHREARFEKIMLAMNEDEGQDLNTQRGRLGYYLKQPKVKKDVGIHLGKLPKYHDGEDELAKLVPERNGIYALHPDSWESTFYSLTNKDFKKITRYQPAIVKIPNNSIVADMAIANQFYRTKDPVEKQKFAKAYKDSIVPYGSDISHIKMPEIIMPRLVESLVELKIEKPDPEDTMGIKRNQMPQIATDDYPEFIDYLRDNGASFTKASVDPNSLKAIQGEFSDAGVIKALQKSKIKKPIIASNDNYIIDGHHRWVAASNTGVDVNIYRVNKPVKELLQLVKDFPKTTYKDIYEAVGIITAQNTTKDVKPGETQRQAAKFGMQLDKDNNPPLLHKKAAKNSKSNKLFNLGIA